MNPLTGIRRVVRPRETRFFLAISASSWLAAIVYWFVSYEIIGTLLLAGLGLATGAVAVRLMLETRSTVVDDDRPFDAPLRSIPGESLAPLIVAMSLALVALATIMGPAFLMVGLIALAWGGWIWLRGAAEEYDVVVDTQAIPDALTTSSASTEPTDPSIAQPALTDGRRP